MNLFPSSELETDEAVCEILSVFDDLFALGDFYRADALVANVDTSQLSPVMLVALLSATVSARDKLPSRSGLVHKARERLTRLCPERVEGLLRGLE